MQNCPNCSASLPREWDRPFRHADYECTCGSQLGLRVPRIGLLMILFMGLVTGFSQYTHKWGWANSDRLILIFISGLVALIAIYYGSKPKITRSKKNTVPPDS